jgi:PBP1b-binding outer membrane lipoprotein LpoB
MCPFCFASIGLIVVSKTSAGGLTALAVKLSQKKNQRRNAELRLLRTHQAQRVNDGFFKHFNTQKRGERS